MLLNGWRSKLKRRFKLTTDSNHRYPVCSNHLNRNFTPKLLDEVWVSDITYIRTAAGWLYLTTIIDLYDRQVIGWSLSTRMYADQTIIPAWKMAVSKREITESLLFHSDRGIQYCSDQYQYLLQKCNIKCSMTQNSDPYENAVAERINGILKQEFMIDSYHLELPLMKKLVTQAVSRYNQIRPHWSNNMLTPEMMHLQKNIKMKTYKTKNRSNLKATSV